MNVGETHNLEIFNLPLDSDKKTDKMDYKTPLDYKTSCTHCEKAGKRCHHVDVRPVGMIKLPDGTLLQCMNCYAYGIDGDLCANCVMDPSGHAPEMANEDIYEENKQDACKD